jgi:hypothetical protein
MRRILLFFIFLSSITISSQELNCQVTVNFDQVSGSNRQVFTTLETAISEFVNQKKWTDKTVKSQERINCAINIIITKRDNNLFEGSIQIQSTRPVFGTSYETPILNIRDNDFNFKYNEFDQFIYNPTRFDSNLISTIVFYTYIILGVDADSFALNGGETYLKEAENVTLQAQQSGLAAWSNQVGVQNRFQMIDNLLSPGLNQFRSVIYNYHRKGLDELTGDAKIAKQSLENSIITLDRLFNKVIGNPLLRLFFDAKADEIVNLYSDGPNTRSKQRLLAVLQKISPNNSSKWRKIN